jgi:hypothetical protein
MANLYSFEGQDWNFLDLKVRIWMYGLKLGET